MKFRAKILQTGKTAAGFVVPAKVLEGLAAGKRPKVHVTLKGYTYRTSVGTVDGKPMIGVSAEVRQNAGVAGGETLEVEVEVDTAPRVVALPPDFKKALAREPKAKKFYEGLSYSKQRALVEPIGQAKTEETRQRRIDKALGLLREGKV
jgi:Bacteriocin-protection, YdeI or OmpD-Associated/Domain of unknown function (DUF1905)